MRGSLLARVPPGAAASGAGDSTRAAVGAISSFTSAFVSVGTGAAIGAGETAQPVVAVLVLAA